MNELKVFTYQSGEVRTIAKDGEPWFVAADVCRVLEVGEVHVAMRRIDDDEKGRFSIPTPGGNQDMYIVNEPGLYSLILGSRKPEAKAFKRWITHDVLPEIRRTGQYGGDTLPDPTKQALAEAKLNNSRARAASMWVKLAQFMPSPEGKQICAHYASAELTGGDPVLPLPAVEEKTYTAAEVGAMLGGISANKIGRIANAHGLKTPEYGIEVWDKAKNSPKQVASWRYNQAAIERIREILKDGAA